MDVSVIIPARNEEYLQKTIDDLVANLETNYEIIVGLDNYWPDPPLKENKRLVVYHSPERIGMRPMINQLARIAKGKYLMRADAHCSFSKGIDKDLIGICREGCTVLATRYELDVKKWKKRKRTDCDYRYLSHPDEDPKGGLRGLPWPEYQKKYRDEPIGETMTISGSSWLMSKKQWDFWGGLDEKHGTFAQEGAEISCKTWLSGGKVLVNKNAWYAHWNRGKSPYSLGKTQRKKSIAYSIDLWLKNKWKYQKYSFEWLINKFAPVPGWDLKELARIKPIRQGTWFKGKTFKVAELWEKRAGISEPPKRYRIDILWDVFTEFLDLLASGKVEFTDAEIRDTRYYWYLVGHLRKHSGKAIKKPDNKGHWYARHKMQDAINLYLSIKKKGLEKPISMFHRDGCLFLWKGYRRLAIVRHLGHKEIPVRILKTKLRPSRVLRPYKQLEIPDAAKGSIQEVAKEQFATLGKYSTDKYWVHDYISKYDKLFGHLKKKPIKILELGVLYGSSLKLWHDYFPRAAIYGVDKNLTSWQKFAGNLDRVKVLVGKQEDQPFMVGEVAPNGPFDIIIDDCGHQPKQQLDSFNLLWDNLNPFGFYVIEDCFRSFQPNATVNVPLTIATLVNDIYANFAVNMLQFNYNLCVVQRGGR